jgi:hypothetical protein
MSDFDPLGGFGGSMPLLDDALVTARGLLSDLPATAQPGDLDRGYFHVSAGPQSTCFGDYTANVTLQNGKWTIVLSHDPRLNAISTFDSARYGEATYMRNRGSVSVCADAMLNATPYDFGSQGMQMHQAEYCCAAMAALCVKYGIDTEGISTRAPFAEEPNLLSHAEAADRCGSPIQYPAYGCGATMERWDWLSLVPLPTMLKPSFAMATMTGEGLRSRTHQYAVALKG